MKLKKLLDTWYNNHSILTTEDYQFMLSISKEEEITPSAGEKGYEYPVPSMYAEDSQKTTPEETPLESTGLTDQHLKDLGCRPSTMSAQIVKLVYEYPDGIEVYKVKAKMEKMFPNKNTDNISSLIFQLKKKGLIESSNTSPKTLYAKGELIKGLLKNTKEKISVMN